jgi:hypothetical protein
MTAAITFAIGVWAGFCATALVVRALRGCS